MPTIYLHIGRGRTGTTLIQHYLSQRRTEIREQGIHYIYADDRGTGVGHQQLAKSFISDPPEYMHPPIEPERVRREVFDEICASTADTILMSSEHFFMATIANVFDYFRKLPGENRVKIILFVRSEDELMESEYNQMVKVKRETRPFSEYIRHERKGCDVKEVTSELERCFGLQNIVCRIYDGRRRDVVDRFLSCIPEIRADLLSPLSPAEAATAANASLGAKALTAARILNSVELEKRRHLYRALFSQLADHDLPALLFDSDQAREFRAGFADSNRAFTERFIGNPQGDLGGRRYSDQERDRIRKQIADFN